MSSLTRLQLGVVALDTASSEALFPAKTALLFWSATGVQARLTGDDQATPAATGVPFTVELPDS